METKPKYAVAKIENDKLFIEWNDDEIPKDARNWTSGVGTFSSPSFIKWRQNTKKAEVSDEFKHFLFDNLYNQKSAELFYKDLKQGIDIVDLWDNIELFWVI